MFALPAAAAQDPTPETNIVRWQADGFPVLPGIPGSAFQEVNSIPDGSGGVFMAASLFRVATGYDIMAAQINADGSTVWGLLYVGEEASDEREPQLAPDGSGGLFVSWTDRNSGKSSPYAQRLDANGDKHWGTFTL